MAGETSNAGIKRKAAAVGVEPISMVVPDDQRVMGGYKECRRNHAASFSRYVVDGCGEFICSRNDPFTCVACGCHRSFHRKDIAAAVAVAVPVHVAPPKPPMQPPTPKPFAPLPLASFNGATETSVLVRDRDIINIDASSESFNGAKVKEGKAKMKNKMTRTRLTKEQKMEMARFADKVGWRSRRRDHAEIHQFCEAIGITKRVFVIWMSNSRRRKDM
ncbi:hypothetical protein PTKIN_Ptkin10aG0186100 [Pterospermum kingtungense]